MKTSRREFFSQTAGISAAALAAAGLGDASRLFAGVETSRANLKLLPSEKEMWDEVVFMNELGVRYCGSPAHEKYVQFLEDGFTKLGMQIDQIPHTSLMRWDQHRYSLEVASGTDAGKELPVSSYCRYSGTTGPDGVTGQLIYCGKAEGPSGFTAPVLRDVPHASIDVPADLNGKIALIEVSAGPMLYGAMFKGHVRGVYNSEGSTNFPAVQQTIPPYGSAILPAHLGADLQKAGAAGVLFAWTNVSDDNASGQMKGGAGSLPAFWIGRTVGGELRRLAESGGRVTITVEADTVSNVPTHTTLATLPGKSTDEVILLWTHTDGNNAIEENGGVAILNLMKYFSQIPASSRNRTITCVLSEAHFNEQYIPTSAWVKERPDLVRKAVAEVGIEHLGCREWADDGVANTYTATGQPELTFAFCPKDPMSDVMLRSLQGTKSGRTAVIDSEINAFSPSIRGYIISKIPIIGSIAAPPYLLAEAPNGHIDKLNSRQYHEQTIAFANVIHELDAIPKEQLPAHG